MDAGKETNALFADMNLSKKTGVVSPIHRMVTAAEDKALKRGFASDANKLLPDNYPAKRLELFTDAIDMESWLGVGIQMVLDKYAPQWKCDPKIFSDRNLVDDLIANDGFKKDISEAYSVQDKMMLDLLNGYFPRKYEIEIPDNAIMFASLRRATAYKIDLLRDLLQSGDLIQNIAKSIDRPIFYLFGGLAHQDDIPSNRSLEELLYLIEEINDGSDCFGINSKNTGKKVFTADFLEQHNYFMARFIMAGLSKRGAWIGATNPIHSRSQGTEAFGPSYIKSAANGVYIIGTDDGGAGCLKNLETVSVYGLTTNIGEHSLHNDLWNNVELKNNSRTILANGFIREIYRVAMRIDEDLKRFENGRGYLAPGLNGKIRSMLHMIANYNGQCLMDSYLDLITPEPSHRPHQNPVITC